MAKTWIVTGCSAGGIGEGIARAVLEPSDGAREGGLREVHLLGRRLQRATSRNHIELFELF